MRITSVSYNERADVLHEQDPVLSGMVLVLLCTLISRVTQRPAKYSGFNASSTFLSVFAQEAYLQEVARVF
eukprot:3065860-Amphidinium_carterae.1